MCNVAIYVCMYDEYELISVFGAGSWLSSMRLVGRSTGASWAVTVTCADWTVWTGWSATSPLSPPHTNLTGQPAHPHLCTSTPSPMHRHTLTYAPAHPHLCTGTPSPMHRHTLTCTPAHPHLCTGTPSPMHQHRGQSVTILINDDKCNGVAV